MVKIFFISRFFHIYKGVASFIIMSKIIICFLHLLQDELLFNETC